MNRRYSSYTIIITAVTVLSVTNIFANITETQCSSQSTQPSKARKVGKTHQLFLDDELIDKIDGLERVINQPVKHHLNPVLTYDKPWEGNCVITWGSVLYDKDEKLFKIWYEVYKKFPTGGDWHTLLCYAISKDGIVWEKPELGLIEYRGSKANNIVFPQKRIYFDSVTVFADPNPTPRSNYRMIYYDFGHYCGQKGIHSAVSPDGIHWKQLEGILEAGDRNTAGYNTARKKFFAITRIIGRKPWMRTCALWESDDGLNFEFIDEIAAPDANDPNESDYYSMITFPYADMRIGFLETHYIKMRKLNTRLMYSHDGLDWHHVANRQTFLQWGPPGSWDSIWITPSHNPPIQVGDQLYIFYQGRKTLHRGQKPFGHIGSIGLAILRLDGFVSLDSMWNQGSVTTTPLILEGNSLHINAEARPGTIHVEVLDIDGNPIPSFTRDDCVPMSMLDSINHMVKWKGGNNLTKLTGQTVKLRFYVQGAKLFSFWMQ